MPDEQNQSANQTAQGGAGQNAANQTAEGGAQQQSANQTSQGSAEEAGLKAGLIAEQKKRQEAESQAAWYQQQLAMMQQEKMMQPMAQPQEPADTDYPTYGDLRKQQAQMFQAVQLQAFRNSHTDLVSVVGMGQGQLFQPSEHLKKVIQANPHLMGLDQQVAMGNPTALSIAYTLAKQQQQLDEALPAQNAIKEQQKLNQSDLTTMPLSSAAAGGGGGVNDGSNVPPIESKEFDDYWAKIKAGAFDTK